MPQKNCTNGAVQHSCKPRLRRQAIALVRLAWQHSQTFLLTGPGLSVLQYCGASLSDEGPDSDIQNPFQSPTTAGTERENPATPAVYIICILTAEVIAENSVFPLLSAD